MVKPTVRDHMARVSCSDEVWKEFKRLAQTDSWQPVNEYLGELVANEVARLARHRARAEESTARDVLAALDQVRALSDDLAGITTRLEELAAWRATAVAPTPQPAVSPAGDPLAERWTIRDGRPTSAEPVDVPEWEP